MVKTKAKIKFGKKRTVYNGRIFQVTEQDVIFSDGKKAVFEYCRRPDSVSVLAFNDKNEILLIKEYRVGYKKNVWFLPGGRSDNKNDSPKKSAIRELREESGFNAREIRLVHKKSPSNTLQWDIYIYAARDLFPDPLPRDPGEQISTAFFPLKKAVEMALDGTIENEFISYNIIRFNEMLKRGEFKW